MEKGTIFLEPFWGRQSLKPQRALLLSSTWSTPPGRCSQAGWGWCGWRGGRGPGGTGRGPAPDSASSEDTHHSSAITEIEVSPAYLGSCEQGAGGRGVLSQSLTVRTQSLSARRGVRCLSLRSMFAGLASLTWSPCLSSGWPLTCDWPCIWPASSKLPGPGLTNTNSSILICSVVTVHCSASCHWPGLVSRIHNYNWRCLRVSRFNQTTSAISWFSFLAVNKQ